MCAVLAIENGGFADDRNDFGSGDGRMEVHALRGGERDFADTDADERVLGVLQGPGPARQDADAGSAGGGLDAGLASPAAPVPGVSDAPVPRAVAPAATPVPPAPAATMGLQGHTGPVSAPEPTVAPIPTGADIRAILCAFSWPCDQALRVAQCESSLQPGAVGNGSIGVMQIQVYWHVDKVGRVVGRSVGEAEATQLLLDPVVNVAVAYSIWAEQGWRPWSCPAS